MTPEPALAPDAVGLPEGGADHLSSAMQWLLAVACGMLVANIYFGQPLTGLVSAALGMPRASTGLIVTLPLIGYGTGLLMLVPLGDLIENRRLILVLVAIEIACLLLIGTVSHPIAFLATGFLMGMAASVVQAILPYASHLTPEAMRGKALGRLVSGIMLGIMLARPVASFVAELSAWRTIYLLSGGTTFALLLTLWFVLPRRVPVAGPTYGALMGSMWHIFVRTELLRRRAFYHAAMFGAFSAFWTAAPLWLSGPPFNLSQNGIAWVALAGVAGAIAPPFAGRLAHSGHARAGTAAAMLLAAAAFLLSNMGSGGGTFGLSIVVATAVLLDFAVSANLVFGQRAIYALGPEERSRLNGLFMATFFVGGAVASALAGWTFAKAGWTGVSIIGVALPLIALAYWATERTHDRAKPIKEA